MLKKILLTIFIVSILIFVLEIGYYFSITQSNPRFLATIPSQTTFTEVFQQSQTNQPYIGPIKSYYINSLWSIQKNILTESILTNKFVGKITNIDNVAGVIKIDNYSYPYIFRWTILGKGDHTPMVFNFVANDFPHLQVFQETNGVRKAINLSDIHVNDTIMLQYTIDMIQDRMNGYKQIVVMKL